ncbi:MAG: hypothetical protein JW729_01180 [Bacteroidales bacterium]|nr:hypothetical protein [Bacteroidales bacterium]
MLTIFLTVSISLAGFPVNATTGSVEITVPVRGAYLYVDPNTSSGVQSPGIADLESNGILAGDTIKISFQGSVDNYGGTDYYTLEYLIGVFSSTNQLLSVTEADRIPDAINAGNDYTTSQTHFSQETTDIPEDFQITPSTGFMIQVPQNAKYLFISMHDSWYPDNTSPNQITVTIEKQTNAFPLEYILAILIIAAILLIVLFFILKRRKKETKTQ